jgi:uncharacterized LabA/DUF88 family protein
MLKGSVLKKIAVFADVQNIYYTTRDKYGKPFNYRKLLAALSAEGEVVVANAYAIDRGDGGQMRFQSALSQMGFKVKLKPYIQRSDGSAKGDWDVGIAIDVMETAPLVNKVVLLSGDGDFDLLLDKIRAVYNTEADVYGVPGLTAQSLVKASTAFHPIDSDLLLS